MPQQELEDSYKNRKEIQETNEANYRKDLQELYKVVEKEEGSDMREAREQKIKKYLASLLESDIPKKFPTDLEGFYEQEKEEKIRNGELLPEANAEGAG